MLVRNQVITTGFGTVIDINVQTVLSVLKALEIDNSKEMLNRILFCFRIEKEISDSNENNEED